MTYQSILGFGGAFTDSASYVFSKLNSTLQAQVLDMYFSESGLKYNMARLPIGSCDFSLENYNYDDVSGDTGLTHFSIDHDKQRIIPLIKSALAVRQKWTNDTLNILGSPWSPPAWMKDNNNPYCPQSCSNCQLIYNDQPTWALYFSKFVSAYAAEGINIWGITIQNEPEYCPPTYEGMNWTPETERDFLKNHLGPQLHKDHPDLNILIYDHNKDHVVEWAQTIYSDATAAQYAWGTAVHWYSGDDFPNLNTTHFLYPDKPILATEATESRETDPRNPVWGKGEHYAHDIMGDMNNWVVGFIDWNLILDMLGGPNHKGPDECEGSDLCGSDSMMLADATNQVVYPQVFYYYVGQIRCGRTCLMCWFCSYCMCAIFLSSKFVPRGSLRVFNAVLGSSLEATAFLTPEKQVVVVVMNTGDQPITFKLLDNFNGSKQAVKVTALAHSIQTYLYS